MSSVEVNLARSSNKNALESMLTTADGNQQSPSNSQPQFNRGQKRGYDEVEPDDDDDDQAHDEVKLWEDGFKDRYYESKFDVPPEKLEFR